MILLRKGERGAALSALQVGYDSCPFVESRSYYPSALAFDALRNGDLSAAEELVREPAAFAEGERIFEVARLHLAVARDAEEARA